MEWWRCVQLSQTGQPTGIIDYYCYDPTEDASWMWDREADVLVDRVSHDDEEPWTPHTWSNRWIRWEPWVDPRDARLQVEEGL